MEPSDASGRPLSLVERILWRLSEAAPLNFTMVARVRGGLELPALQAALARVQARHPLLRVRIEAAPEPWFRPSTGAIAVRAATTEPAGWVRELEDEINAPVPWEQGPLVRCVWVRHAPDAGHLLLTFHHAVGDGMSGTFLLRDLFAVLGGRSLPEGSLPLPVAIDERFPPRCSGLRGVLAAARLAAQFAVEDWRLGRPAAVRADEEVPPYARRTRILPHEFDREWTTRLVERTRRENTTVHGALCAAVCLAVAQDIAAGRPVSYKHRSPVNVRDDLSPSPAESVGLFASMLFFRGRVAGGDDFWSLAREIRRQMHGSAESGSPLAVLRLMRSLYKMLDGDRLADRDLALRWRQRTPSTTGVTNIGRVEFPADYDGFLVESLHFAVSPSALVDFSSTAASFGGRLNWNFMCPEPLLARPHAELLVADIVARLNRATE